MDKIKQRDLTRDKICKAALDVINEEGLEGLSMRRLAQELNIEAASLYNHIKNKSELLDLIQDNLFKNLPTPKEQIDWKKYLNQFAVAMRNGLLQYPNVVPLFATRPSITAAALEQTENTFRIMRDAGFKYADIIFAYQSLCVFVLGHLQAEVGHVPGEKAEMDPSIANVLEQKKFPHLMNAYSKSGFKHYDKWFKFGIKIMITGLEDILQTTKSKTSQ